MKVKPTLPLPASPRPTAAKRPGRTTLALVQAMLLCGGIAAANAQAPAPSSQPTTTLPEVVVTGVATGTPDAQTESVKLKLEAARENTAGSVVTVSPEEIALQKNNNLGEILARIPGASYVDEDGHGTKTNIGLRGLNPIRSEYVQLLQDGIPLQPSLYSETAAYYGPPAERVSGIEVFKGGSSILFGPNTVGGVVNFLSRGFPDRPFSTVLDGRIDTNGDYTGNLYAGGTVRGFSYGVEYMKKGGNGFRDNLGFNIDDFDIKFGYRFNQEHTVQFHFSYYDERSETPGGLLPEQFEAGMRKESNKHHDVFYGRRVAFDLRSSHQLTDGQRLELLFYTVNFRRDWYMQKYVSNTTTDLTLTDTNEQFLRTFQLAGFEPKYVLEYDLGQSTGHELTLGGRIYFDTVHRRAATGNTATARDDNAVLNSDEDLSTSAYSAYVQNEFKITSRLSIVPGIRFEHIEQTWENLLVTQPTKYSGYNIWVPGIGAKYEFAPRSEAYANVSRSFRPPSFGDSFNPVIGASSLDLKPSSAWTYEAGIRANPYPWLSADLGGFYTDYKDQVVVSGTTASNYDTKSYGFEGQAELGVIGLARGLSEGDWSKVGDHEVFLQAGATLVNSTFADGLYKGNTLPYVPKETVTFGVKYAFRQTFDLVFQGRYVGSRFTDSANTVDEDPVGLTGKLASYVVCDVKARWQINEHMAFNVGVNNLFDESYITQRRNTSQKGVFPGPTRAGYAAITLTF